MKIVLSVVAFFAISTALSAQSSCTFTTVDSSTTRVYDGPVRVVQNGNSVNIVNRRTGEVLDNVAFEGNNFRARCSSIREDAPARPTGTTRPSFFSRLRTNLGSSSTSSSSGGGFPASAALGLPSN